MPPDPTDDAATARLPRLLALTLLVGTVNGLSRVAMPLYAVSLGAQPWQVGVVGGLGYVGMMSLALPMGAWIDRHGTRSLFVRGSVLAAVLYLLLTLVRLPWQAIAVAAVLGAVLPFRTVPAHTEFLAMLPTLSPSRAGWNRAANMTGMHFAGPALAAAAIAAVGFAPVFAAAAAMLLAAGALATRVLQPSPERGGRADPSLRERMALQLELLRQHADLRRTMGVDFLAQMASAYFVVFGIAMAVRQVGMSLQAAAGLVTLQGIVYVAVLLAAARPLHAIGPRRAYRIAFVLLAAQALLFAWAPHPAALWTASVLMGAGVGIQGLLSTTRFAQLMRSYGRGRIAGLTSLAPPAGGVLGAIGGGVASQQFGAQAGFVALGLAFATLALWPRAPAGPAA